MNYNTGDLVKSKGWVTVYQERFEDTEYNNILVKNFHAAIVIEAKHIVHAVLVKILTEDLECFWCEKQYLVKLTESIL